MIHTVPAVPGTVVVPNQPTNQTDHHEERNEKEPRVATHCSKEVAV